MSIHHVGDRIRYLGERGTVPINTVGVVTDVYEDSGEIEVEYQWYDARYQRGRRKTKIHAFSYEGRTWVKVGTEQVSINWVKVGTEQVSINLTNTQGESMFSSTAVETIKGWVPQVKYNGKIVWQGDPVPAEVDGEKQSEDQQITAAQKAAQDKINEVVKGLFA